MNLNLVLYIHLRIFGYSSNILMTSFERMDSMLASGTWKNLRFFRRSCSFRERAPAMKLTCLTIHPWCCIVLLRALRRDSYWFSALQASSLTLNRYWSVTSENTSPPGDRTETGLRTKPSAEQLQPGAHDLYRTCRLRILGKHLASS